MKLSDTFLDGAWEVLLALESFSKSEFRHELEQLEDFGQRDWSDIAIVQGINKYLQS